MSKFSDKFNRLSTSGKFWVVFLIFFILGFMAIPICLHEPRRIFPDWPDWKFIIFGVIVCAAYATLLAGCWVLYERFTKRK
jgi:drug/metabolite transporter (DMT)-like permease